MYRHTRADKNVCIHTDIDIYRLIFLATHILHDLRVASTSVPVNCNKKIIEISHLHTLSTSDFGC